ncbi:MAG: hypothetical protein BWK80_19400 [Desulfobacteraceae bacterium IS3]|nr:MAG: hypothetical protein BWK80_19400 [Desulfobacteraceae bacterium IS3]
MESQTLKEIDLYLEEFYPKSIEAGNQLARVKFDKTQVRGLETLVASTNRFSEIMNYIKNQAGKEKKDDKKWSRVAPLLLGQLEELEKKAKQLGGEDISAILGIKMRLARGWIRQVVTHYLYEKSKKDK